MDELVIGHIAIGSDPQILLRLRFFWLQGVDDSNGTHLNRFFTTKRFLQFFW
ncbi:Uncharacterised protein [Vibrio cholerae]|nr:Uncharacterised protein [Vibrio cholerae]CSI32952.1 Uncharacterised protein [Vibrio cholerae]